MSLEQPQELESKARPEAEELLNAAITLGVRLRDLDATDALAHAGRMSDALRNLLFGVQWVPMDDGILSRKDFPPHPLPRCRNVHRTPC